MGLNVLRDLAKEGAKATFGPSGCATVLNTAHTSFVLSYQLHTGPAPG